MQNEARKEQIRREIKLFLKEQLPGERLKLSEKIKQKLFVTDAFRRAKHVMFYVSTNIEVETSLMIDEALTMGKAVSVPYIDEVKKCLFAAVIKNRESELEVGPFGIKQPKRDHQTSINSQLLGVVVVPAIAFTLTGDRLGRGGGYYDKFLSALRTSTKKIGLAFSFQIKDKLPMGSHDQPVDLVITP